MRGAVGAGHSDSVLLERYGQLLDALGDRVDAGRYLFASGVREARYALADLPAALQADLRHRGVPDYYFTAPAPREQRVSTIRDRAVGALALALAILFLLALVVGMFKILDWVVDLFR